MPLRVPEHLVKAFRDAGVTAEATVFAASDGLGDEWEETVAELRAAFQVTQAALQRGSPVVYVVAGDDLLGRRGPGRAMVACGLLSAARTAAVEGARAGVPVNTLAVEADTPPATVAAWVARLLEPGGPTGELVRLGTAHLGKALP
jgi:hypothetical protein